ncbi:MAG: hypothetical protein ACI9DK_000789 [Vicingaceae bacterium]|jgi:hypothetical protein
MSQRLSPTFIPFLNKLFTFRPIALTENLNLKWSNQQKEATLKKYGLG